HELVATPVESLEDAGALGESPVGIAQRALRARVRERLGELRELLGDRVGRAARLRDLEERPGVASREHAHAAPPLPAPARKRSTSCRCDASSMSDRKST